MYLSRNVNFSEKILNKTTQKINNKKKSQNNKKMVVTVFIAYYSLKYD